jgi:nanoRNase/pAp phosphatase (c-di-AMP/oligoRNAs hydrolase)
LVIITPCNSYDASAAKGLIDLGADVSFVFAWEKKPNFRITARASTTVLQETKLDLSKVMERIGIQYGGSGGGHDGAAGCYGTIDAEDCIQAITPFLMEVIRPILEHKKVGE